MSAEYEIKCTGCRLRIITWSDGGGFIEYPKGKRNYYIHPCESEMIRETARKILGREPSTSEVDEIVMKYGGCECDYLCLDCGKVMPIVEGDENKVCKRCKSNSLELVLDLDGKPCPRCEGTLVGRWTQTIS